MSTKCPIVLNADLEGEESHDGESDPGVEAVEVGDGRGVAVAVGAEVVRVEHGDEADDDAGDGQDVEDGVQQLVPDAAAAAAGAVHQHGWKKGKKKAILWVSAYFIT